MSVPCDIEDGPPHVRELARSVCAIVFREALAREDAVYRLLLDQGRLPIHGTGFLVAPNIVATALHVVGSSADAFALVFDFVAHDGAPPERVDAGCVRATLHLEADPSAMAPGFALLYFEDPIIERKPLALSRAWVARGDRVFAIGHPAGTTTKYFPARHVVESEGDSPVFAVRDLGTTCGNSGSPIFAAEYGSDVVGSVSSSITTTNSGDGTHSRVTAIRATRLADAVHAHARPRAGAYV